MLEELKSVLTFRSIPAKAFSIMKAIKAYCYGRVWYETE